MKPFNLEAALAGAKVITRRGHAVTQLVKFEEVTGRLSLAGVYTGDEGSFVKRFSYDGKGIVEGTDLFMAPEVEIWYGAWYEEGRKANIKHKYTSRLYPSLKELNVAKTKTVNLTNQNIVWWDFKVEVLV